MPSPPPPDAVASAARAVGEGPRRRVLVPYDLPDLRAETRERLDVVVWDGSGPVPSGGLDAELYVVPYDFAVHLREVVRDMPRLRVVQTQTAGVEHLEPYLRDGLVLCNARGVHETSTAELAVALVLASLRGLPGFVRAQDRGEWTYGLRDSLADRRVLVVGYGSIGRALAERLRTFECEVTGVASTAREDVHGADELPALLPAADVVVLLVPLTGATRHLVDAAFLARMRDGALLVNVSRGGVVDTDALLAELVSGRLRAALDVTDPEPLPPDHPLWRAPGLLLTPHVGGASTAFLPRAQRLVRDQLERFAAGRPLRNVVAVRSSA